MKCTAHIINNKRFKIQFFVIFFSTGCEDAASLGDISWMANRSTYMAVRVLLVLYRAHLEHQEDAD